MQKGQSIRGENRRNEKKDGERRKAFTLEGTKEN